MALTDDDNMNIIAISAPPLNAPMPNIIAHQRLQCLPMGTLHHPASPSPRRRGRRRERRAIVLPLLIHQLWDVAIRSRPVDQLFR
jgi:hypothetical protein